MNNNKTNRRAIRSVLLSPGKILPALRRKVGFYEVVKMEKGATKFDGICHKVFEANGEGGDFLENPTGIRCGKCGHELSGYYCEDRLYLIECRDCNIRALVMASGVQQAAYSTLAHVVQPDV